METFVKPNVGSRRENAGGVVVRFAGDLRARARADLRARVDCASAARSPIAKPGDFFTVDVRRREPHRHARRRRDRARVLQRLPPSRYARLRARRPAAFAGSIQCPYHAWTYGLDGTLKVARNMTEVPGFDRGDYPLKEARVGLWEGFIFVNLSPDAAIPFERAFAPLIGRFSALERRRLADGAQRSATSSRATGSSSS